MKTQDLKEEISDLPVEERVELADYILKTLNHPDPEVEKAWGEEAERRLDEIENGEAETVSQEEFEQAMKDWEKEMLS